MSDGLLIKPSAPEALVSIENVTKHFGEKIALENVSWSPPAGQISGLLGPNGAGKTTLFRLLMGILQSTSGKLTIKGCDCFVDGVAVKRLVGYLPDEPVFYSYLTGLEILQLSASMHDLQLDDALSKLEPFIERLDMKDALLHFAEDYSRGMKKKLGVLLAIVHEPTLLILDEPTNGLDVESTQVLFEFLREQAAMGRTVVFSTHLMDQVERLCSHIAILAQGKCILSGELKVICQDRSLEQVFVELTGKAHTA